MSKVLDRLRDLLRAEDDIVADELRSEATARGCTAVAEAVDRQVVTVAGTIRSVTLRPEQSVPALVAELYDGTTPVNLVWLGRREIRGIRPGVYLRASGRLCRSTRSATIYNPSYDIVPTA
ncbi:OB-fold nucleic acid binding domain-containing protein [Janibacter endophyticus]|uniref:OB-fold nucleic acid binding domain-containing protein n=1 Tax=Janibacter endophyticus TaxID=2806261 RepID=UPI0027DDAD75|nr:OB-fold nucleic acid binding domain-containing protein [Janibacter endophyticus]